jgi:hypothetical protein
VLHSFTSTAMGSSTVQVLITAVLAMAKILVITLLGVLCALRPKGDPLFPQALLQQMGRLCNLLFLPALIASSIGANVTLASLQEYLPLLFGDTVVRIIGYIVVLLCGKLLPVEPRVFRAVKVSTGLASAAVCKCFSVCSDEVLSENNTDIACMQMNILCSIISGKAEVLSCFLSL